MKSLPFLLLAAWPCLAHAQSTYPSGGEDRAYSVGVMERIARPVLQALAENKLKSTMPVRDWDQKRKAFTYEEAYARTMAGIAPWLELGPGDSPEGKKRAEVLGLALRATHNVFDPEAADHLGFSTAGQPLVESAFLSLALLRAPKNLWGKLSPVDQERIVAMLKASRRTTPGQNNWLLFSAIVETALWKFTGECERKPIETAVNKHMDWYVGDGTYGDGPQYHWDYYNSYVIHPMLLEVLKTCHEKGDPLGGLYEKELLRAQRYGTVLERLISPEGTFPVMGRSSAYRFCSLQLLSQLFLSGEAPPSLAPGPTRSALTAVIRRMIEAKGTFDNAGWLQIGAVGEQKNIHESYNSTGSLYLATCGLLHLGLPPESDFWTKPGGPWTQKRIWNGDPTAPGDGALKDK